MISLGLCLHPFVMSLTLRVQISIQTVERRWIVRAAPTAVQMLGAALAGLQTPQKPTFAKIVFDQTCTFRNCTSYYRSRFSCMYMYAYLQIHLSTRPLLARFLVFAYFEDAHNLQLSSSSTTWSTTKIRG